MNKLALLGATAIALCVAAPALGATTINVLRAETVDPEKAIYAKIEAEYEALHPDIDVKFEYLANEAYKQKLTTLLQSNARPDIFYSWGGGVLEDQAHAGFLRDITDMVKDKWTAEYSEAGVGAFTVDGKIVGAPVSADDVVIWANRGLAEKAGIDLDAIKTWDDFLASVEKAKAADIIPIMAGGKDKWPLHFYYGYLALRLAGEDGFRAAINDEGDGFASEPFVKAGEEFLRLVALDPFQPGLMDTTAEQAYGRFGDGEAVFEMMGGWGLAMYEQYSQSGEGVAEENLETLRFPAVPGGNGKPTDTFGGINGWVVTSSASDEAVDFLAFLNSPEKQAEEAAAGLYIPTAKSVADVFVNRFYKETAEALAQSTYHQIFLDQALGADVGATFNDLSADLAQGVITAEEAAEQLKEAWDFR